MQLASWIAAVVTLHAMTVKIDCHGAQLKSDDKIFEFHDITMIAFVIAIFCIIINVRAVY